MMMAFFWPKVISNPLLRTVSKMLETSLLGQYIHTCEAFKATLQVVAAAAVVAGNRTFKS